MKLKTVRVINIFYRQIIKHYNKLTSLHRVDLSKAPNLNKVKIWNLNRVQALATV